MNTETKNRHSQIVNEIKQEVVKLTQENLVLRNCWSKEQGENEQQRHRIRLLLEENALLRNQIHCCIEENHDLKCQIEDLLIQKEALLQGFFIADTPALPHSTAATNKRVHNLDDGSIFKGNKGNKGNSPRDLG